MRKLAVLLSFLLVAFNAFTQAYSVKADSFMRGTLIKGNWRYSPRQKIKTLINFSDEKITIKDSIGITRYRLLKDLVTKRIEEDSCITSLRTGFDNHNIRCMINLVEFDNGINVLNIMYAAVTYSYYFRRKQY